MLNRNFDKNQNDTAIFVLGSPASSSVVKPKRVVVNTPVSERAVTNGVTFFDLNLFITRDKKLYTLNSNTFTEVSMSAESWKAISNSTLLQISVSGASALLLYSNQVAYGIGPSKSRFSPADSFQLSRVSDDKVHGKISQVCVGYSESYLLNDKHEVFKGNGRIQYENYLKTDQHVVKLSSGYSQVVALTNTGHAYFNGYGCHGEGAMKGSPSNPTLVSWFADQNLLLADVSCGIFHTMWLTRSNELYISGRNTEGQLGNNLSSQNTEIPQKVIISSPILDIQAGGTCSAVYTTDNRILFAGAIFYLSSVQSDKTSTMTDVVDICKQFETTPDTDLQLFESYYNDPAYEKAFAVGSATHYVFFKKAQCRGIARLFPTLQRQQLCDIEFVTRGAF